MADKEKKIANYFRHASYENKPSKVVKSIERWVKPANLEPSRTSYTDLFLQK